MAEGRRRQGFVVCGGDVVSYGSVNSVVPVCNVCIYVCSGQCVVWGMCVEGVAYFCAEGFPVCSSKVGSWRSSDEDGVGGDSELYRYVITGGEGSLGYVGVVMCPEVGENYVRRRGCVVGVICRELRTNVL